MKKSLRHYGTLARRWAWVVVLGIVICSGAAFLISKKTTPVYQASATLILSMRSTTSVFDNVNTSLQALPTYAQLVTSSSVLTPVVAQHRGLSLRALSQMITVNPQANTQLIELDVQNTDPQLAMQLANEVSQSFQEFVNSQLPGTIQILPAQKPLAPIRPNILENTSIGAAVGLCLALALIVVFEWIDDRLSSPEEAQELLGMEIVALVPPLSRKHPAKAARSRELLTQGARLLSANLEIAQRALRPFKLVMVTSALAGEGKTTIAAEAASCLAKAGKQVLLVDVHLGSPAVAQHFQLENQQELIGPVRAKGIQKEARAYGQMTTIPNLRVLTAEALSADFPGAPEGPSVGQLYERVKAAPFDYIIFDAPPLLDDADAQLLASSIQMMVVVVDPSQTPRKAARRLKHMVKRMDALVIGAVMNNSPWTAYPNRAQRSHPEMTRLVDIPSSITAPMAMLSARTPTQDSVGSNTAAPSSAFYQKETSPERL